MQIIKNPQSSKYANRRVILRNPTPIAFTSIRRRPAHRGLQSRRSARLLAGIMNQAKMAGFFVVVVVLVVMVTQTMFVVAPGYRGVLVTLGAVSAQFKPEGFGAKMPAIIGP